MDPQLYNLVLQVAVFGAVFAGIWAILSLLTSNDDRVSERLSELKDPRRRGDEHDKDAGFKTAFNKAAPTLSKAFEPKTDLEQSKLRVKLANAGFSSPRASTTFLAIKVICMITGAVIAGAGTMIVMGVNMDSLLGAGIGAGLGLFIPDSVLSLMAWKRKEKIFLSLPDALDLLVVCVEAGLGLDAAMRRVAEELTDGAKEICDEINHCNFQLQMGRSRREVLHDFGIRTGVDDVKALAAILIQADKFGSSIAQALRVQSDSMRIKRSQLAEEKAAMTAVKMIFPLVLFIFPGIFVVLVGPAAILMIRELLTT